MSDEKKFQCIDGDRPNDERMQCARCKKPIESGQAYANVRTPTGEVPVHGDCLREGSSEVR